MSPKIPDAAIANRLVEAAARLLAEEGRGAVTARRLATEVEASTMAVYTHFGGMDQLLAHVRREGFRRFGAALDEPDHTDDPVADWMCQGFAYRRFALDEPHLYRVMFGDAASFVPATHDDAEAALATFQALIDRVDRCVSAGRWTVADLTVAGESIWAAVHGHASIELAGYFAATGRDPLVVKEETMRRIALGSGDQPTAVEASLRRARARSRRA